MNSQILSLVAGSLLTAPMVRELLDDQLELSEELDEETREHAKRCIMEYRKWWVDGKNPVVVKTLQEGRQLLRFFLSEDTKPYVANTEDGVLIQIDPVFVIKPSPALVCCPTMTTFLGSKSIIEMMSDEFMTPGYPMSQYWAKIDSISGTLTMLMCPLYDLEFVDKEYINAPFAKLLRVLKTSRPRDDLVALIPNLSRLEPKMRELEQFKRLTKLRRLHKGSAASSEVDTLFASEMAGGRAHESEREDVERSDDDIEGLFGMDDDGTDDLVPSWMSEVTMARGVQERILDAVDGERADLVASVQSTITILTEISTSSEMMEIPSTVKRCLHWVSYAHALIVVYDRRHPSKDLCRLLVSNESFPNEMLEFPEAEHLRAQDWTPGVSWTTSHISPILKTRMQ